MKNTKHIIYTILIIICSLTAIGFYIYIFSLIEKNNVSVKNLEVEIKKKENQKAEISKIKNDIEDSKDIRMGLDQHFLTSGDIVRFFDSLETESKIAKLNFSIMSASELRSGEPFVFELKTFGTYEQNYHFLKILENLPYDLRVNDYAIRFIESNGQIDAITGKIMIEEGWEMNISLQVLLKDN